MTRARWAALAVGLVVLFYGFEGGEYGTTDWLELRRRERSETAQVGTLQRMVDSLTKVAEALEGDPRTQERVARETFGMIRRGEFLYRIVPAEERAPEE